MSAEPARASVQTGENGLLQLQGELDFVSVLAVREQLAERIAASRGDIMLDLSGLQRVNSVGLSLLLRVAEQAAEAGRNLRLRGVPAGLQSIAEVCGLDTWLHQVSAA
ncbi:STAS domain-containing protein [Halopseudomonas sabulinigri]|uniref:Phospholipid transport system transporter-binding protein n=1 Tax=Halopseudomonas sabulinigri TaxID=472181 RepID=A0A1H1WM46_9GAMM|nr:STAS domain-containing protein [Halopseudomonas sabulinigri]SDS98135.1 phospholipid transport system transporter-binding protein [Halopseudomonas sabulinigri]